MKAENCLTLFRQVLVDYHQIDQVDTPLHNPYPANSLDSLLYHKCWVDTVQWHLEDLVRDPSIEPVKGLELKRRIDASNQLRTDLVEKIDDYILAQLHGATIQANATLNTESPAWAIDRLSILALKIYHMREEAERKNAGESHQIKCAQKLSVLLEQEKDLSLSIDQLLEDLSAGKKMMKVYRQMKMYNDASLNPVLYQQKQ
ncbi:MAG: DUF4254 domain-containing protein [Chitinophagaceae bacterium]|nr:DUF4254 domain-containing protein [Chitinophagaceae bacterium]